MAKRAARYEDIAAEFHRVVVVPRRVWIDSGYDLDHLRRHFRRRAIAAIDEASIREYALTRQDQGAPAATINGEIRTLDRVLQFAVQTGKLRRVPRGEFLPEPLPAWFGAPNPLSRRVDPVK
jgi:hypothetical protein